MWLNNLTGFEVIDITGTGNNTINIDINSVKLQHDSAVSMGGKSYTGVFIKGNAGDTVDFGCDGTKTMGGFSKVTGTAIEVPSGYTAYWANSDKQTLVYVQDNVTVI